ncbi:MAG TPA: ATP-binding protein [Verrucomicrobiae bacterium]|jgi:signal transduction histidine kinase|nr:ATP-binding protein [Verrucomicrobiae bacterium]
MNLKAKFRLAALGLAAGLMGVLIALATVMSQRQGGELRSQLHIVDSESAGISEHFKDSLREVNNIRLRYTTDRNPADWQQFLTASHDLDAWLDQQTPKLTTSREKDLLRQVKSAYTDYLDASRQMYLRVQTNRTPEEVLAEFTGSRPQSQRLYDLGQALAKAHYDSRNAVLVRADAILEQLRQSVLALVGLLFLFGLALALLAYRDWILPLHVKLVETQSLAERHEKLASLGMLAAGVAHEIRNPLTAIKAAVFIQQKKFPPGSPEASDAALVQREILRLERIVTEFLQFARPSEPELTAMSSNQPLKEVQALLAPALAKDNIQLLLEVSTPLPVKVDGEQMKQVLINLVQNAAESIGHNGSITLRSRPDRKPLAQGETDVVILEVADTGVGIAPDVEKRLFDPFFTTKAEGTGLGLSIAACIVQKHGGALQYQTQVNHGTTFGIILPRAA